MDIISNPEMADAAVETAPPTIIRREEYRPPAWLVPEVALDFALGLEKTRVRAVLQVAPNPASDGEAALRLNGDGSGRGQRQQLDHGRRRSRHSAVRHGA